MVPEQEYSSSPAKSSPTQFVVSYRMWIFVDIYTMLVLTSSTHRFSWPLSIYMEREVGKRKRISRSLHQSQSGHHNHLDNLNEVVNLNVTPHIRRSSLSHNQHRSLYPRERYGIIYKRVDIFRFFVILSISHFPLAHTLANLPPFHLWP